MTYNPFQWQVLGMLSVLAAGVWQDSRILSVAWMASAVYCFACAILDRRRPK